MKIRLFYPAIMAAATVALTSCDKDAATPEVQATENQPAATEQPEIAPNPDAANVAQAVAAGLEEYGFLAVDGAAPEFTPNEDGSVSVRANVTLKFTENLLEAQHAPESFNEERKAINEAANKAMQPDSLYLMQIGASTNLIKDEDRAAKPMPENLQTLANELKELADSTAYAVKTPEGATIETTATMKATKGEQGWQMGDVVIDLAPLSGMSSLVAQSAMPEGGQVLTPEFENARKEELKQKIADFNEAAHVYNLSREEAARTLFTERSAQAEEESRKAMETAAAAAAETEAWEKLCEGYFASGKNFGGEWKRGNRFGEITIHIEKAERFDGAVQFIGSLYDTKLPEASLQIAGRCDLKPSEDGMAHVDVTIYDGQYDPDQPTAEVYDAQDGMLSLSLNKEGKLSGIMGCSSWVDSGKNFEVSLTPKAETQPEPRRRNRR